MKTKNGILLGCGIILLILVGAFVAGYFLASPFKGPSVSKGSWLVLNPSGVVPDYTEISGPEFLNLSSLSVDDICTRIRKAETDGKIQGIIIRPGGLGINQPNLREIKAALQDFKRSKKPVIAHAEVVSQNDYLLCTMADKIYMDPSASAGIMLEGVSGNILFYSEALKKLGVKMHVMQAGDYKGAGEPYTRRSLSPEAEQNLRQAFKGRYDLLRADISAARGIDSTKVWDVYETRPNLIINAKDAKTWGLIDEAATWEEVRAQYKIGKDKTIPISRYGSGVESSVTGSKIAVVNLSGNISSASGYGSESSISLSKVSRILNSIEKDNTVKAVVLRVNSPGGSALESELIYQRIKTLKIPVVVSMGGVAASGGYYISCAADHIIADPHTITGSIGVIMALPEAAELGRKLGIDSQTISYGKFSGFGNIFESYDPELLASLNRESEAVYDEFRQRVMEARKIGPERIDEVSEGRVFIASDALALGLVDGLGDLDAAVKKAAELAGIQKYSLQKYPIRMGVWEALREGGLFNSLAIGLKLRSCSPQERLEAYLHDTLPLREWLYYCPYLLDR
ncbi:MAG: signal peptide peptidase SppA [Candidatus Cloacimonetes bacterium]|nr:signal peptide peptidase SppA [Candidatus Cloacimonadota bacterium]